MRTYLDEVELAFDVLKGKEVDVYTMCNYTTASNVTIARSLGITEEELYSLLASANAKMASFHAGLNVIGPTGTDTRTGQGI